MTNSSALEYAESIADTYRENMEAGNVFGLDEDGNEIDVWDWMENVLDIRYIFTKNERGLELIGAQLLLAFGGPNAWLNTLTQQFEVSWWSETQYAAAPIELCAAINEALSETIEL